MSLATLPSFYWYPENITTTFTITYIYLKIQLELILTTFSKFLLPSTQNVYSTYTFDIIIEFCDSLLSEGVFAECFRPILPTLFCWKRRRRLECIHLPTKQLKVNDLKHITNSICQLSWDQCFHFRFGMEFLLWYTEKLRQKMGWGGEV